MPINGGTRMLRARRKDINVKPNRRLDRKSSRGMLFENEELRMRTITINAEVEQGQHALKKLRRENEQLRREMWSLRDEYDKMEKLLRKKETDEDSDQENSDSDDNYSQSEYSEEEKEIGEKEEENADGSPTETKFGNVTTTRAFDGLSVIDEQTEETTTQTTESAVGYSRSNSANRTLNQLAPAGIRSFDDPSCDYSSFYDSAYPKMTPRKKAFPMYETDSTYVTYATDWPDNGYEVRPSSPYPYSESVQPSYQRRFEVLQNLPPMMSRVPTSRVDENGWIFPSKQSFDVFPREAADSFVPTTFLPEKSVTSPITIQIPRELDYSVVQDRAGPDVFISDVCAKKPEECAAVDDGVIKNVEAEIDKIEITEKPDKNAKVTASQIETCKTKEGVAPAKLTTAESVDKGEVDQCETVEDSVSCQNPSQRDVQQQQQTVESEEMARADKSSKFQSKLVVTLKTPAAKPDGRATLKRVPPVQAPPLRSYNTLGYGIKPDYQGKRYVGFPECRYTSAAACRLANGGVAAIPSPALPPPLGKIDGVVMEPANIPVQPIQDGIGLLTEAEATSQIGVSPLKPIKIPPAPPPRTTSCLGTTIPDTPIGVTATHHRTFRGGESRTEVPAQQQQCMTSSVFPANLSHREPQEPVDHYPEPFMHNPLMLSEPMATSSPTMSPRMFQRSHNLSLDNLSVHRKPTGMTTNDESSTEDVSMRKTRTTGRSGRHGDVPHLNKSVSSPSFGTFLRRKASEHSVSSVENGTSLSHHGIDRKITRGNPQNNVSVSSSSGLDSPTKSDRRKRRVSIKFNKKIVPEDGDERGSDSRQEGKIRGGKVKSRHEETDVTTSERERTNSVSSRASSGIAGSSRRKLSISSNRTYINDEKIPWCGCWGNGCV